MKVIDMVNRTFGIGGWASSVLQMETDFVRNKDVYYPLHNLVVVFVV
jgi:recombination DNA repair RAD52 pathway protein